jgi:YVTN family beta-propeller protein
MWIATAVAYSYLMKRLTFVLLFLTLNANADTLLVLNKSDATLSFIDPATLQTLATIPTGDAPHEVAVSDDGHVAVVANYGTGPNPGTTLSVIDVRARKELRRVTLPGLLRPHGIQAIGARFWFTAEGSRVIARYDPAADRIDFISGSGADTTHMIVVAPGEKMIYTANIGSNNVTVFDVNGAPRVIALKQIPVVKGPEGIDLAPDGSELWVASRTANGGIAIINPATNAVSQTLPTTTRVANRVKFTRDGKFVLVSDTEGNLLIVYDAATKEVIKTVEMAAGPSGIVMAPDGKHAFVACAGAKRVQVLELETMSVVNSADTGNVPDGLAYARN